MLGPLTPLSFPGQVVSQIDKLTSDFDFELEPDDWTTATVSSTSSSDKAGVGGP